MENYKSILDKYKEMVDVEPKLSEKMQSDGIRDDEELMNAIRRYEDSPINPPNLYTQKYRDVVRINDSDLQVMDMPVKTVIRHAVCPKCGKIVDGKPEYAKDFKTAKTVFVYKCGCGAKLMMDRMYPCIVYLDDENNEVSAYTIGKESELW